jgi:hypothetical protein
MTQRRCPLCVESIDDGALICKECGSLLYSFPASAHAQKVQPSAGETDCLPVPSFILGILCVLTLMNGAQFDAEAWLGGVLFSGAAVGLGTASLIRQQLGRGWRSRRSYSEEWHYWHSSDTEETRRSS